MPWNVLVRLFCTRADLVCADQTDKRPGLKYHTEVSWNCRRGGEECTLMCCPKTQAVHLRGRLSQGLSQPLCMYLNGQWVITGCKKRTTACRETGLAQPLMNCYLVKI